jgi:soluble lytic murein transglycosylase-like protein
VNAPARKRHPRIALRVHRKNIWISELLSYILLSSICVSFFTASAVVLRNELTAAAQARTIARTKASNIAIEDALRILREKSRIAETVRAFTNGRIPPAMLGRLVGLVYENGTNFGYDPLLVLAVIHVESVFDPDALGKYRSGELSGALGLMQIKFETAKKVARDLGIVLSSPEDLMQPEINVPLGIAYLTRLTAQFKSFRLGVIAYNLGPGAVIQSLSTNTPLPPTYYAKALRSYYRLRRIARDQQ